MRYNAFISYRHGELDGLVAEKLHRMLETYKIPTKLAQKTGKKRIERVFRDRDELPTSSDLSGSIDEALQNSEYLILICSKRTCQSMWVMREVERFSELHGEDKIVALLIDGEPDESFPPKIRWREINGERVEVEPLAADIRASDWAKSIKLLKSEKLRLLAPILGCAYDDLKQRHRERRIKRITTIASCAFAAVLAFGSFSFYQFMRISEEMQLKLRNQSYVLAEYSESALTDGDLNTAALLALEALPNNLNNPERPYVPAAEKALTDAVRYYNVIDGFDYHKNLALQSAASKVVLSPNEYYTAIVYPYAVSVFQNETGKVIVELPSVKSALNDVEFLSDNLIIYTSENVLAAYDINAKTVLWTAEKATRIAVSSDKSRIAAIYKDNDYASVYDVSGNLIEKIDFNNSSYKLNDGRMSVPFDDTFLNPHDNIFELNDDGSSLAVSLDNGIIFIKDIGGSGKTISNDGLIYANGEFYNDYFIYSTVTNGPYSADFYIVNYKDMTEKVHYKSETNPFYFAVSDDNIYYANKNILVEVEPKTGERVVVASFNCDIEAVDAFNDTFIISGDNNNYYVYDRTTAPLTTINGSLCPLPDGGTLKEFTSDYLTNFIEIGGKYAITAGYDSLSVRILKNKNFSDNSFYNYDREYGFTECKVNEAGYKLTFYSYDRFRIVNKNNGEILADTVIADSNSVIDTQYSKKSGNLIVIYDNAVRIYSGENGQMIYEAIDCQSVTWSDFGIHTLKDGNLLLINPDDISVIDNEMISPDNDFGMILGNYIVSGKKGVISYKHRAAGAEEVLGERELVGVCKIGENNFRLALITSNKIEVYSINEGVVIFSFEISIVGDCFVEFINGGDNLAIIPYHGIPYVYDVNRNGKVADLKRDAYLTEVFNLNDNYIISNYINSKFELYTLILDAKSFEAVAEVPLMCDFLDDNTLLIDDGSGSIRKVNIHNLEDIVESLKDELHGVTLTEQQKWKYHID